MATLTVEECANSEFVDPTTSPTPPTRSPTRSPSESPTFNPTPNTPAPTFSPSESPTARPSRSPNTRRHDVGSGRTCYGDTDCRRAEICNDEGFCAEPGTTAPESGCCVVVMEHAATRWQQKCATASDSKNCLRFGNVP